MATTTVFESPTALGAKLITISTTITNTSGAYSATITDERLTASMKAIKLELGDPSVFDAVINVAVNNGSLTISCASVAGTSTAVISVLKTCDDPTAITTTEFDVLANRIGDLDDLETTAKTDLVSAVNENSTAIAKLDSNANSTNDILADAVSCTKTTFFNGSGGSYTGSVPDANYKWATFMVNVKASSRNVIAQAPQGTVAINSYGNGAWSGWQELATKSDVTPTQFNLTNINSSISDMSRLRAYKLGKIVVINGYFTINATIPDSNTLFISPYKPLWLQVGHMDKSGSVGNYYPIYCLDSTGAVTINSGAISAGTYDINMMFFCK